MEIMEVAARHLATRPRSTVELENYLRKKEFHEVDIKDAVRKLTENGYLNDSEYARTYIRYALGKRKSLFRIKYEIKEKGVSQENIENGIYIFEDETDSDIKEIEYENALAEAARYIKTQGDEPSEKKQLDKAARRLNSLGYSASVISSVLGRYR